MHPVCVQIIAVAISLLSLAPHVCYANAAQDIVNRLEDKIDAYHMPENDALRQAFNIKIANIYSSKPDSSLDMTDLRIALFTDISLSSNLRFLGLNEHKEDHSCASAIKVVLLCAVFHEIEASNMTLDDVVDGLPIRQHIERMITNSSNDSANILLHHIGIESINSWLDSLGFYEDQLSFGRYFRPSTMYYTSVDSDNIATAAGLAIFYFLIAQNSVEGFLSESSLNSVRSILSSNGDTNSNPHYNDRLNGNFNSETVFYHKTGANSEVIADAGIVRSNGKRCIMAVFDTSKRRDQMPVLGSLLVEIACNF